MSAQTRRKERRHATEMTSSRLRSHCSLVLKLDLGFGVRDITLDTDLEDISCPTPFGSAFSSQRRFTLLLPSRNTVDFGQISMQSREAHCANVTPAFSTVLASCYIFRNFPHSKTVIKYLNKCMIYMDGIWALRLCLTQGCSNWVFIKIAE